MNEVVIFLNKKSLSKVIIFKTRKIIKGKNGVQEGRLFVKNPLLSNIYKFLTIKG